MKKVLMGCLLIATTLYSPSLHSQGDSAPLNVTVVPPAPNAAALGKFVDMPVSLYTGTPNVSIPIYELNGKEISLPISLSYHASGLKVEEIPSWVGAGWALNAGGVVSRSIRGLPDEQSGGYFGSALNQFMDGNGQPIASELTCSSTNPDWDNMNDFATGQVDSEPDLYFFSIPGKSGKFVFRRDDVNPRTVARLLPSD